MYSVLHTVCGQTNSTRATGPPGPEPLTPLEHPRKAQRARIGRDGRSAQQTVNSHCMLHQLTTTARPAQAVLNGQCHAATCAAAGCCAHALLRSQALSDCPVLAVSAPPPAHSTSMFPAPLPPSPGAQAPSNLLNLTAHSDCHVPRADPSVRLHPNLHNLARQASILSNPHIPGIQGTKAHVGSLHGKPSRCLLEGPLHHRGPQHGQRNGPAHAQPCQPQGA